MTSDADSPLENGVLNSRTLLLPESTTQRFPLGSKAIPVGPNSPPDGEVSPDPVRLVWPITRLAASPVENGGAYSRTRLLLLSTAQRSPLESKATAVGLPIAVGLGGWPATTVVVLGWPMTMHMPA